MEFQRRPAPVTEEYRANVADTLTVSEVTRFGLFHTTGTFDVVGLGEKKDPDNTTPMWALNLLRFTPTENRIRTRRDGFLLVCNGRSARDIGDEAEPDIIKRHGNSKS